MPIRPKLFLIFSALCISPLLILSLLNFRSDLKNAEILVRSNLQDQLDSRVRNFEVLLREREHELKVLAAGPISDYLAYTQPRTNTPTALSVADSFYVGTEYRARKGIAHLPFAEGFYAGVACFDPLKHERFLAESSGSESKQEVPISFRTKDFLPGQLQADERVWNAEADWFCSLVTQATYGKVLRCSIPVHLGGDNPARGALVADLRIDSLLAYMPQVDDLPPTSELKPWSQIILVLDPSGEIIYHTNVALKHQLIGRAMPSLASASSSITSGETGSTFYTSSTGERWIEAHAPLKPLNLSLLVARNYSLATADARRAGWVGIALAVLLGLTAASFLTSYFQRKTQRIERVTESVAAIAGGNLDKRVEAPSSDDMRVIAEGVNLVTERLREQLAREAEARQFESFTKLSALLTHDLKNAIEGLSLMVGNMERHFDNPMFRADAMRSLTDATNKLRNIVSRLSNPVNTLSGEFKMPRPTDLVPVLQRVLVRDGDPVRDTHEIEVDLPASLMALADGERIEKVMENLLLNAIEAMTDKPGKLTIKAGLAGAGKVFFSISDTGAGMSPEFIRHKLFRPFSTTKVRGVGLGLYTCREVVRANNGSIEVESKVDFGTTFRVVLASAPIR
ncbi:MAG: sensor histidine kinase [Acidobacteriota bacterium]|nr:sensor histidine kinase [Acidobacteriota bacterium]